jgi:hypothetical protein
MRCFEVNHGASVVLSVQSRFITAIHETQHFSYIYVPHVLCTELNQSFYRVNDCLHIDRFPLYTVLHAVRTTTHFGIDICLISNH